MTENVYATISAGSIEYSLDEASVSIEELIEELQQAQHEGATHVVGLSGNYRGASYVKLGRVEVEFPEDDEN